MHWLLHFFLWSCLEMSFQTAREILAYVLHLYFVFDLLFIVHFSSGIIYIPVGWTSKIKNVKNVSKPTEEKCVLYF